MDKNADKKNALPPGQQAVEGFPVFPAAGNIPKISKYDWQLEITGLAEHKKWNWEEFNKLSMTEIRADIHCVTHWSKLDTIWKGVSLDKILEITKVKPAAQHMIVYSYDGYYSTNIPIKDIINGQAIIATSYEGKDIPAEHGGPVRLVVPHLYFWKSAKWIKTLEFSKEDKPGFWETHGYHNYGDPWKEERYS